MEENLEKVLFYCRIKITQNRGKNIGTRNNNYYYINFAAVKYFLNLIFTI